MENRSTAIQEKQAVGTSSEILVGVFDDYSHAQQAFATLLAAGFPLNIIQIYPKRERDRTGSTDIEKIEAADINTDIQRVLGVAPAGTSRYQKRDDAYIEAVQRGHYLLVVNAHTDEQIDQSAAIMNRFKVVDIEERSAYWEHQGWTGYHENAEEHRSGIYQPVAAAQGSAAGSKTHAAFDADYKHAHCPGDDRSDYYNHWQNTYGSSGGRYEQYGSAYHYGSSMARCARYKGIVWSDMTAQLRSGWESNYPGTWEQFKEAVHYGAERENTHRH